jgi:hypothetical protein
VLPLTEDVMPRPEAVAAGLASLVGDPPYDSSAVDGAAFEFLSARASTRALAEALDRASARAAR